MATYKALPDSFGRMNPKYQSPSVSTWFIGGTTAAIFVILTFVSHGAIQADSILCIGLLIAFYYGLVGFTCAWHFRSVLRNSPQDFVLKGLIPLFGAVVLAIAFVYSAIQMWAPGYGLTSFHGVGGVFLLGIGTLVLGVLVMLVYSVARPAFFRKGAIEQMEQLSNLDRATTE
jgi:amino acid transporter